ncbi:MAG: dTDP-4-dehydrorhamnose 3,5-epimerase family protein, partial [Desulfovibrionaceae bacterium]|nr:dTDP-4-dehydrorhamnose 3,5-epimerase family protein [Desulfovibrionaceae bacterium]
MEMERTPLEGVWLFKPQVWGDKRGYFVETWQAERYAKFGLDESFVQDNHSMSTKNILRGLHYQKEHPQGKLVYVSYGRVFDVAVDIRPNSPSFGRWYGVELNE